MKINRRLCMLVDAICWAIACVIVFGNDINIVDDYHRWLLALGFIFVGTVSRFVSTYREVHSKKTDNKNT